MSLIDKNFIDVAVYIVIFKSKSNNREFTRTIVAPFSPDSEKEGINYMENLLYKVFQENIDICSVEWLINAWMPKL